MLRASVIVSNEGGHESQIFEAGLGEIRLQNLMDYIPGKPRYLLTSSISTSKLGKNEVLVFGYTSRVDSLGQSVSGLHLAFFFR